MNSITIAGHVDPQHRLSVTVPDSIPPGPVTIVIVPAPPHDETAAVWMRAIAQQWNDELGDPSQYV